MVLWRISGHRDLKGIGGLRVAGRWHYAGQPIVYLAENPASALLEVCVHTSAHDIPPKFLLLKVIGPDVDIGAIKPNLLAIKPNLLPEGWQHRLEDTREIGTEWLRQNDAVLLRVPSAILPHTHNFLFNPLHTDARRFRIANALSYPFDPRIKL